MPLARRACQYVAVLMAMTGLPSQSSAAAARRTMDRLVPTCTRASTSSPSIWRSASRHWVGVTSAMPVQDGHCRAVAHDGEAHVAEIAHDLGAHNGPVG